MELEERRCFDGTNTMFSVSCPGLSYQQNKDGNWHWKFCGGPVGVLPGKRGPSPAVRPGRHRLAAAPANQRFFYGQLRFKV
jgi:hypothetical protein